MCVKRLGIVVIALTACDLDIPDDVCYTCELTEPEFRENRKVALSMIAIGAAICFIFKHAIFALRLNADLYKNYWNLSTVRANDFAIQISIPETEWNKWLKVDQKSKTFKEHLISRIQDRIDALLDSSYDRNHEMRKLERLPQIRRSTGKKAEIATIEFAYSNKVMLDLLK